jgi:site-specific recombinase XerD
MAMNLHILFWLNTAKKDVKGKHPLIIRLTYKKARKQLATPFKLNKEDWLEIESGQRTNKTEVRTVREFITTFKARILNISNKLELEGVMDLEAIISIYTGKANVTRSKTLLSLIEQHNQKLLQRIEIDRARSTLDKYRFLKDKVQRFLTQELGKKDIALDKLEAVFIKDFVHFLITKEKNQHNTVAKYVKNLKHVITFGIEHQYIHEHPFEGYKMGYKDVPRSYLTKGELDALAKYQFANQRLELVRDVFLFQCYTGLAYVDMANLTQGNILEGVDNKPWIITYRQKTKSKSLIPLLQPALNIISKYKDHPLALDNNLLPTYAIQKFNTYLKELALVCGIDKPISSHAGRRTFATTVALGNGVSLESISKILGHSNTKMTSIYAVVTDMKLSEEMNRLGKKL